MVSWITVHQKIPGILEELFNVCSSINLDLPGIIRKLDLLHRSLALGYGYLDLQELLEALFFNESVRYKNMVDLNDLELLFVLVRDLDKLKSSRPLIRFADFLTIHAKTFLIFPCSSCQFFGEESNAKIMPSTFAPSLESNSPQRFFYFTNWELARICTKNNPLHETCNRFHQNSLQKLALREYMTDAIISTPA